MKDSPLLLYIAPPPSRPDTPQIPVARSFQVFITRLRRHLAQDPHIRIINVRGTGYKLIVE